MAKFAVALLFLTVLGVTLGSGVDDLVSGLTAPLDKDLKKCESLSVKMAVDIATLVDKLGRYEQSMNSTIEADLKELDTKARRIMKQNNKSASAIQSSMTTIEAEGKNHVETVNTCMRNIVKDLLTQYNETAQDLKTASANINRTLLGIKNCTCDNDYSTGRCTLRYVISRKCDYLDGVTELLKNAAEVHTAIELAAVRMDNTCEMTKTSHTFKRTTTQAETDMRKMSHSG